MRILVTGANGQLGREINKWFSAQHELILTDIDRLDITNHKLVKEFFTQTKPQAVIHCAAYTNVDGAESDYDGAFKVNVIGSQNLASQCLEHHARMVYVSTDYVFDGNTDQAYCEFSLTNPQSVYGKTKLIGEELVQKILPRHYIVRTAWLYGDGNNFVRTMLRLAKEKEGLQVVNDQIGSPTYTKDLASAIFRVLDTDAYGVYHASCNGQCSWYEFAVKIFELKGISIPVQPVPTEAFPRPANRPKHSVLRNYMLEMSIGDTMRNWEEALKEYLDLI